MPAALNIVFLTRSLQPGGAERQLVLLACGLARRGHDVSILSFYGGGPFLSELAEARVRVVDLKKRGTWDLFTFTWNLVGIVRTIQPDILHAYLAMPNVLATMLGPFVKRTKIVWGVRASELDLFAYGRLSRFSYFLERLLSRFPALIICNSMAGKANAIRRGYPESKLVVVSNGIDTQRFNFDAAGRKQLREHWRVSDDCFLVGIVARVDPAKDHRTFLRAAELISRRRDDVRFVCVGDGTQQLASSEEGVRLGDRLLLEAARSDLAAVYSAMDVVCLTSVSEGFSNVVGEAMACSRACVATDVGDSKRIIGDAGTLVAPADARLLADLVLQTINSDLAELGRRAREHVSRMFSVDTLISESEKMLSECRDAN